jgi:hypothetical protein
MYKIILDTIVMPVPPEEIKISIKGRSESVELANQMVFTNIRTPDLREVEMELRFPCKYWNSTYAQYPKNRYRKNGGYIHGGWFVKKLEYFMLNKKAVRLYILRRMGTFSDYEEISYMTSLDVTVNEVEVEEKAEEMGDFIVNVTFLEYYDTATKTVQFDGKGNYTIVKTKTVVPTYTIYENGYYQVPSDTPNTYNVGLSELLKYTKLIEADGQTHTNDEWKALEKKVLHRNGKVMTSNAGVHYAQYLSDLGFSEPKSAKKKMPKNATTAQKISCYESWEWYKALMEKYYDNGKELFDKTFSVYNKSAKPVEKKSGNKTIKTTTVVHLLADMIITETTEDGKTKTKTTYTVHYGNGTGKKGWETMLSRLHNRLDYRCYKNTDFVKRSGSKISAKATKDIKIKNVFFTQGTRLYSSSYSGALNE